MRTLTTSGHQSLVMANMENNVPRPADELAAPTVTTGGRLAMVVPYYSQSSPTVAGDVPAQTVTTKDRLALVVPAGWSCQDQATPTFEPASTQTARESKGIAWTDDDIDACRFRMFALEEIAGAMRLDYHPDGRLYVVTGNKRERMAQYGNAVTPPAMALIVGRLLEVVQAETFTDMFCGAGGSSLGAEFAGGRMKLGLNHWQRAIDTHSANFEHADHDCADVSLADPRRYPATDILLASPECTNHSLAKGARRRKPQAASLFSDGPAGDAEQDKSRATMWDVVRFAEAMVTRGKPYKAIVVENVTDAFKWGANDDGGLFASWLMAMDNLGYEHELVWLNSMLAHGGIMVPQSRDRMYPVFWLKGARRPNLKFTPTSWCTGCEKVVLGVQTWKRPAGRVSGKYGQQYFYTCPECRATAIPGAAPADAIIDWTLPAKLIGERKKPLAEKTIERVRRGLERLGSEPFAIRLLHSGAPKTLTLPLVTLTTRHDMAMVLPVGGNTFERTPGNRARDARLVPLDTVHGTHDRGMVVPPMGGVAARPSSQPSPTQTTTTRAAVVQPPEMAA
jgi:DNA (cytosine-5)-methyltransferase 1